MVVGALELVLGARELVLTAVDIRVPRGRDVARRDASAIVGVATVHEVHRGAFAAPHVAPVLTEARKAVGHPRALCAHVHRVVHVTKHASALAASVVSDPRTVPGKPHAATVFRAGAIRAQEARENGCKVVVRGGQCGAQARGVVTVDGTERRGRRVTRGCPLVRAVACAIGTCAPFCTLGRRVQSFGPGSVGANPGSAERCTRCRMHHSAATPMARVCGSTASPLHTVVGPCEANRRTRGCCTPDVHTG